MVVFLNLKTKTYQFIIPKEIPPIAFMPIPKHGENG
jgi:hypothetical protein